MQKTIIIGHLGGDAQQRESNGRTFITFSVADSHKYKKTDGTYAEQVQWVECISNSTGVLPYLKKGTLVSVVGRMTAQGYEKNGEVRASLRCNVQELNLLGSSGNGQQQTQVQQAEPIVNNSMNDNYNDLPF